MCEHSDSPFEYYRQFKANKGVESTGTTNPLDKSQTAIREDLHRIVRDYLGNDESLHELTDQIAAEANGAIRQLNNGEKDTLNNNSIGLESLEVIVKTDGSRPSFLIRNGMPDINSFPVQDWDSEFWTAYENDFRRIISYVGRINDPEAGAGFSGTGFLVGQNMIMTNRHVLQEIADELPDKTWEFRNGVHIDFGHELNGVKSFDRREFEEVVFCGPDWIKDPIVHTRLDVVLISLKPSAAAGRGFLRINENPVPMDVQDNVFVIGYPARPASGSYSLTLLEKLFSSTFGHKRIAPGLLMTPGSSLPSWTFLHDATTLGGNSGSPVVLLNKGITVSGIHYGGQYQQPRRNYSHAVPLTLDGPDQKSGQTLRQVLASKNIELI